MLGAEFIGNIGNRLVDLWEELNLFGVRDMARRIEDAGGQMTASAAWQEYKLRQAGKCRDEIQKELIRLLPYSDQAVRDAFVNALDQSRMNDAAIFADAGVTSRPFGTHESAQRLQALFEQTNGTMRNFTRTTAVEAEKAYIEACDRALLRVQSGLQSKEEAVRQAITEASQEGLTVRYPSGWVDSLEVAVRRAVQTGANQAALRQTIDTCEDIGTNYVIISSHLGARTHKILPHANHFGWQGKIYRIADRPSGFWGALQRFRDIVRRQNYPLLEEATGYPGDPLGLGGYNCRHSMFPYIPGVTENHMQKFDEQENEEAYKRSQDQRALEREMRRTRREYAGLEAAGEDTTEAKGRLKNQIEEYNAFCEKHNLTPQMNRTWIAPTVRSGFSGAANGGTIKPMTEYNLQFFGEKALETQTIQQMEHGIRSFKKRIAEHEDYLRDPRSHVKDWDKYPEDRKRREIHHWKTEIKNFKESIKNREEEISRRKSR